MLRVCATVIGAAPSFLLHFFVPTVNAEAPPCCSPTSCSHAPARRAERGPMVRSCSEAADISVTVLGLLGAEASTRFVGAGDTTTVPSQTPAEQAVSARNTAAFNACFSTRLDRAQLPGLRLAHVRSVRAEFCLPHNVRVPCLTIFAWLAGRRDDCRAHRSSEALQQEPVKGLARTSP